ncbi:MAG: hypothetical protein V1863_03330 [Candidatus Omnitrophota bacterium]
MTKKILLGILSFMAAVRRKKIFYAACLLVLCLFFIQTLALAQELFNQSMEVGETMQGLSQLDGGAKNILAQAMGSSQAGDFGVAKIMAYVIFGAIGFIAFMYGRKTKSLRPTVIGVALMGYPYLFSGTTAIYVIGVVLTVALFLWRE